MNAQDRRLFNGLDRPELPRKLQQQALWRARAALRSPSPPVDFWSFVRASRGWRLAWGLSIVALCIANLALGSRATPPIKRSPLEVPVALDPEIIVIVDLPPLRLNTPGRQMSRVDDEADRPVMEDLS